MLNHLIDFLGRTHLVVLHFPIALITIAAIVESLRLLYLKLSHQPTADLFRPSSTASIMLAFALASTLVAASTGLILGYDYGDDANLHRILGITATVLVVSASIALLIAIKKSTLRSTLAYLALLIASALAVTVTAHLGGSLTHGEGFLTDPLKAIFTKPEATPQTPINPQHFNISQASLDTFNDTIQPILDHSCIKCHGRRKQKGDIRLDTLAFVLDEDFDIVERGDPEDSELIYRIELPREDEDAMPPLKKSHPLTKEQIQSLRDWITSLAP